MKSRLVALLSSFVAAFVLAALPLSAQTGNTYFKRAIRFAVSPPLSELARLPQPLPEGVHEDNPVLYPPRPTFGHVVDPVEQKSVASPSANYTLGANILGVGRGFNHFTVQSAPPDTNLAVGDTQVFQWADGYYTVCSKTSPYTCGGAIAGNTLWQTLGGPCYGENGGDVIAQWDQAAHRWLLAQNYFDFDGGTQPPYYVCVAVSTSADALGTYYLYQFPVVNNGFPDYPKWGAWSGDYGQTWNNFGPGISGFVGAVFCIYDRAKMLAGDPHAEQICHQYASNDASLLPADRDSPVAPPSGRKSFRDWQRWRGGP